MAFDSSVLWASSVIDVPECPDAWIIEPWFGSVHALTGDFKNAGYRKLYIR